MHLRFGWHAPMFLHIRSVLWHGRSLECQECGRCVLQCLYLMSCLYRLQLHNAFGRFSHIHYFTSSMMQNSAETVNSIFYCRNMNHCQLSDVIVNTGPWVKYWSFYCYKVHFMWPPRPSLHVMTCAFIAHRSCLKFSGFHFEAML